jgi:ABC-type dipeptide/oligopeptide/nickel transport system permease component
MGYVLRRLAASVPVLLGITLVAFLLIHPMPGDPAQIILFGSNSTPAQIADLRQRLSLNDPLWLQYLDFLGRLLHGDLGTSYLTQNSVAYELFSRLPSTLILTSAAMVVAIVIGVTLGMVAGLRPSLLDRIARTLSFLGVAVPYFFLALLLVLLLSVHSGALLAIDDGTPQALLILAFSLGWGYSAILTRLVRGRIIEEYHTEYRSAGCWSGWNSPPAVRSASRAGT